MMAQESLSSHVRLWRSGSCGCSSIPNFARSELELGLWLTTSFRSGESYLRSRDAWLVNMSTRATRRVSVWDNLGVDRLLVRAASGLREEDLPEPVLQIIRARLGDELLQTLRSYLAHGGDVAVTVGTLHIHRSTLYYRLGRIRDLSGVDVADANLRAELTIGLRMAELGGHGIPD